MSREPAKMNREFDEFPSNGATRECRSAHIEPDTCGWIPMKVGIVRLALRSGLSGKSLAAVRCCARSSRNRGLRSDRPRCQRIGRRNHQCMGASLCPLSWGSTASVRFDVKRERFSFVAPLRESSNSLFHFAGSREHANSSRSRFGPDYPTASRDNSASLIGLTVPAFNSDYRTYFDLQQQDWLLRQSKSDTCWGPYRLSVISSGSAPREQNNRTHMSLSPKAALYRSILRQV